MGIGVGIFLVAVGAILRFAVTAQTDQFGVNIHTGGVILMFVGGLAVVLSMLFWSSFAPFARSRSSSRREEVITEDGHEKGRVVRETRDRLAG